MPKETHMPNVSRIGAGLPPPPSTIFWVGWGWGWDDQTKSGILVFSQWLIPVSMIWLCVCILFIIFILVCKMLVSCRSNVHPFVRPSVRKLCFASIITRHRFELELQNLLQPCIMGYPQLVLEIGVMYLALHGHFVHFVSELEEIRLVHAITPHSFALESPNLHQTCTLAYSMGVTRLVMIRIYYDCD